MNARLLDDPELVYGKEGFLVVIAPKKDEIPEIRASLRTPAQYFNEQPKEKALTGSIQVPDGITNA